ncbi:MAG TPA: lysine-sensitive aspartokinase 3 [Gemmatimonadaceae bacterium]|nr:lysine-sensitive aspartokinase 3 [Gemmatimonadaceae bacterium]
MIVVKFGGTSVGDAEAIERAAGIVKGRLDRQPAVVVSALGGATSALLAVGEQAAKGHLIGALRGVETIRSRHLTECENLLGGSDAADEIAADISASFDELASLAEALATLGHATPRSFDAIASFGEILSSQLVAAFFRLRDIPAEHIDARDVFVTDRNFTAAEPQIDEIADRAREVVQTVLQEGRVPVMGGFIGRTSDGITTTLGRGGSDYSASLLGAALHADAIEIWTDVEGMLTGDPRIVKGARLIEQIRFDEASELASFGAKVLHPNTIAPAVRLGIPVFIYNSRNPGGTGTRITFDAPRRPVSAIAGKGGVTVVKVGAAKMLFARGFLRQVFEIFERDGVSVDVVATSEVSISVTVDDATGIESLLVDLSALGDVSVERDLAIVAVVGAAISDSSSAMGRAIGALGDLKIHMMSLSASGINLTIIVDGDALNTAMGRLHAEFFSTADGKKK